MTPLRVQVSWKAPMLMVGRAGETTTVLMDAKPESGGSGVGPTPMETVLIALAGCTGVDVVGILRKMRARLDGLVISASGEQAAEHPRGFTRIHVQYAAWGSGLGLEQVTKAVTLSREKYCSVWAMLSKSAEITYEISVAATVGAFAPKPTVTS